MIFVQVLVAVDQDLWLGPEDVVAEILEVDLCPIYPIVAVARGVVRKIEALEKYGTEAPGR